jgi:hypothetical protein
MLGGAAGGVPAVGRGTAVRLQWDLDGDAGRVWAWLVTVSLAVAVAVAVAAAVLLAGVVLDGAGPPIGLDIAMLG